MEAFQSSTTIMIEHGGFEQFQHVWTTSLSSIRKKAPRVSPMAPRILFRISRIPWFHPCCCVPPFWFSSSKTLLLCLVSFLGMRTQPIWEPSWMTRPSTASETGGFNMWNNEMCSFWMSIKKMARWSPSFHLHTQTCIIYLSLYIILKPY